MSSSNRTMNRLNGILGMFIGIFGALAILGVFFKIAAYPGWETMMAVGFMGEAAAFIVMGIFALIAGFRGGSNYRGSSSGESAPPVHADAEAFREEMRVATAQFGADLRHRLQDAVGSDLSTAMQAVGEQTRATCDEIRSLGESLAEARQAIDAMRIALGEAAAGDLAADAERLGIGMRSIAEGMEEAGTAVETMRRDVTLMAERFRAFNGATVRDNGQEGGARITTAREGRP